MTTQQPPPQEDPSPPNEKSPEEVEELKSRLSELADRVAILEHSVETMVRRQNYRRHY